MFRKLVSLVVVLLFLAVIVTPAFVHAQDGTDTPAPVATQEVVEAVLDAVASGDVPVVIIEQPATPADVADAPLHEQAKDAATFVFWGVLALIVLAIGAVVLILSGSLVYRALNTYLRADQGLAHFGNTPMGHVIHSGLGTAETYIDSPDDPFIQQGTALANNIVQQALGIFQTVLPVKPELLTPEEVSRAAKITLAGIRELFDGIPLPDGMSVEDLVDHLKAQG